MSACGFTTTVTVVGALTAPLGELVAAGTLGFALIDPKGRVVGMAFAIAPDRPGVAYALDMSEVNAVLEGDLGHQVDTGSCVR